HQADGAVGNPAEPRKLRAQIADQQARKQRADARAQRDLDVADRNTDENADDAAKKDGEPHDDEVDGVAGRNDDTDTPGRFLHDRLGSDDAKYIAALQDDAGGDRKCLTAPAQRAQIETARPVLLRRLLEIHAGEFRIDQENVSRDQWDVEQLP